jgi:hypothetical protein
MEKYPLYTIGTDPCFLVAIPQGRKIEGIIREDDQFYALDETGNTESEILIFYHCHYVGGNCGIAFLLESVLNGMTRMLDFYIEVDNGMSEEIAREHFKDECVDLAIARYHNNPDNSNIEIPSAFLKAME